MERLEEEFRDKKLKLESQHEDNSHEIDLLEAYRDQICHDLETKNEKEIITKSDEIIFEIQKVCEKEKEKEIEE